MSVNRSWPVGLFLLAASMTGCGPSEVEEHASSVTNTAADKLTNPAAAASSTLGSLAVSAPTVSSPRRATQEDLNTYRRMAAVNACFLSQSKVSFNSAFESNVQMVVSVLSTKHGGLMPGVAGPRTHEQLASDALTAIVLQINALCGKSLPADWKTQFDPLLAQAQVTGL
jgi:hypothetical protein